LYNIVTVLLDFESTIEPAVEKDLQADEKIYDLLPSEFGETPPNYVSAYVTIRPDSVIFVSKNGLRPEYNQMGNKAPDQEELLEKEKPQDIKVSRKNCVYAYPDIPSKETSVSNIREGVLMEVLVNPKKAYVADAYPLPEVSLIEREGDSELMKIFPVKPWVLAHAKEHASLYWKGLIPYTKWLMLSQKEKSKYTLPELLYNETVPLKHMRRLN